MKYKLIIFDMDGTILNTIEDLADSLNYILLKYGYPTQSLENVRNFVGNGAKHLIKLSLPKHTSDKTIDLIHKEYRNYYQSHCNIKTKPYNGIRELIQSLRKQNLKTAVVSNKPDATVKELSTQYFQGLFDISVGEKEGILKKPAPDSVNNVLKQLNCNKRDCVYIGDSEVDIKTAQNAGIDSIIVSWGFRDESYLKECGADIIVHTPEELARLISIPLT